MLYCCRNPFFLSHFLLHIYLFISHFYFLSLFHSPTSTFLSPIITTMPRHGQPLINPFLSLFLYFSLFLSFPILHLYHGHLPIAEQALHFHTSIIIIVHNLPSWSTISVTVSPHATPTPPSTTFLSMIATHCSFSMFYKIGKKSLC